MNLRVCRTVCKECPFSKRSPKGWLGGLSAQETLDAMQYETLFSCHLHREEDTEQNLKNIENGTHPICRGFLISATKSCKLFGQNPETGKALFELQSNLIITEKDKEDTLTRWDFLNYHENEII